MPADSVGEKLRAFCEAWNAGDISPALRMASMLPRAVRYTAREAPEMESALLHDVRIKFRLRRFLDDAVR